MALGMANVLQWVARLIQAPVYAFIVLRTLPNSTFICNLIVESHTWCMLLQHQAVHVQCRSTSHLLQYITGVYMHYSMHEREREREREKHASPSRCVAPPITKPLISGIAHDNSRWVMDPTVGTGVLWRLLSFGIFFIIIII